MQAIGFKQDAVKMKETRVNIINIFEQITRQSWANRILNYFGLQLIHN